nr:reverse transcriptase domain-containing protein [Tanacetum cinerariifolium]
QEVLGFSDTISSGNPTPFYDPIVSATSSTLTPFGNSDFLLEEVDAFLAVEDEPTSSGYYQMYLDPEGDILLLESFLNDDPSPPPDQGNYLPEVRKDVKISKTDKSSIDEPPEVELKDLPPHLEYAFLEGNDKLPVITAKDLSDEEKTALITILKSHKQAITWKLSDIKGINPEFCTHKIFMEEDFEPAVRHQRRVNLKIHDVIKKEVLKLLNAGLIYPISDSPWTGRALIDVFEGELTLRAGKEAITFNLDQTSRYSVNYNGMTANKIDVIDMACEEYSQEVLDFSDMIASGNLTPYYDPIVSTSSPTLTLFENSDFLLEEVDAFLALEDDPTLPKIDHSYFDTERDILLLESFLNDDPLLPPPNQGNYLSQV